ncbi:hypothetical protein [Emcibacter sp. SYSU 3D8]|uniref:hypothetical protein n=1 Tax=Emcibacter sp. SYSU 3D8 TaxID=3133969 RepID=UPI0031FE8311
MTAHLANHPGTVNLFARRTRGELVEMLVRAHRNGDSGMTETCNAELDQRTRQYRDSGRAALGPR